MDLISILLSAFHIISALLIVVAVLLQSGKGGGLAGLGGGSSSAAATQMFGGGGAGNFLSRSTVVLATIFMATSLALAYIAAKPNSAMDLGETSGGVASQEDPILEEGTGPLNFDTVVPTPTPEPVKIDLPKVEPEKEDAAIDPTMIEIEKIAAEKAEVVNKIKDAVKPIKKDPVKPVKKEVKEAAKPIEKAAVKKVKEAVKNVEAKTKKAAEKVEDSVKPTTP